MSEEESDRSTPSGLGFAVWSDDEARVRRLLAEGASADECGELYRSTVQGVGMMH